MRKLLFLFAALLLCFKAGESQWVQYYSGDPYRYDGSSDAKGHSVAVDGSGNCYVAGTQGDSTHPSDILVVKYDNTGHEAWSRTYGGPGNEEDKAFGIAVDNATNIYVTGYLTMSTGNTDCVLLKYDSNGNLLWARTFNGAGNGEDQTSRILIDGAGSIYICGYATGMSSGKDYLVVKYNSSGSQQWAATFNGGGNNEDKAFGIAVDGLYNVYETGWSQSVSNMHDIVTVKYTSSGIQQWVRTYDGAAHLEDKGTAVVTDGFGNAYVTGYTGKTGSDTTDCVAIKYNTSGTLQWTTTYNAPSNSTDKSFAIILDDLGYIYITGYTTDASGKTDFLTVKYNPNGNQVWTALYNGPGNGGDQGSALSLVPNKVVVTGPSYGSDGNMDYAVVYMNSTDGVQVSVNRFAMNTLTEDVPKAMAVSPLDYSVFITGFSKLVMNSRRDVTVMSTMMLPANGKSAAQPKDFALNQNYPNPFNPKTIISYQLPVNSFVTLKVFDLLGREVSTLQNGIQKAGSYEVVFDGNSLSSGTYFCRIQAGDFQAVGKMLLIK